MLTFEKVLEVFGDYLAQDKSCEVLDTSRGHLVVDWESCKNNWVSGWQTGAVQFLYLRQLFAERKKSLHHPYHL